MNHRTFAPLALLALLAPAFAATGCSHGSSPTEPALSDLSSSAAPVSSTAASTITTKRHGADDPAGDDRGGQAVRGADDPAGDRRGGQNRPARGAEFSGVVSSVDGQTLILASGLRVTVNGQTQWN